MRKSITGATHLPRRPGRKNRDISVCAVQYIIDHPHISAAKVSQATGVSAMTVLRLKKQLGIKARAVGTTPSPDAIAARCGWDVYATALALEQYGHELTTRQVVRLCGKKPMPPGEMRRRARKLREAQLCGS